MKIGDRIKELRLEKLQFAGQIQTYAKSQKEFYLQQHFLFTRKLLTLPEELLDNLFKNFCVSCLSSKSMNIQLPFIELAHAINVFPFSDSNLHSESTFSDKDFAIE